MSQQTRHLLARRKVLAVLSGVAAGLALPQYALGQDRYPSRPLRFVVTTPPGGKNDLIARLMSEKLASILGQQVVVENKPGANGIIAARDVAKAAPDGHTVLVTLSGYVQNIVSQEKAPYSADDFIPVSNLAMMPVVYAVSSDVPAETLEEWIALAKSRPDELTFGSIGMGSSMHIIGEGLNKAAGISVQHIAYKGTTLILPDLSSGRLASAFGGPDAYTQLLETKKARLLAVASTKRLSSMPDLPTFAELGYPSISLPGWGGLFLPAGTPAPIVRQLNDAVRQVMAMPDVQRQIHEMGFEPLGNTSEEFQEQITNEIAMWTKVIAETGINL